MSTDITECPAVGSPPTSCATPVFSDNVGGVFLPPLPVALTVSQSDLGFFSEKNLSYIEIQSLTQRC